MIDKIKNLLDNFEDSIEVVWVRYFYVEVKPEAKQSVRFAGHAFTPTKKKKYLKKLAEEIKKSYDGPTLVDENVRLTIIYSFPWRAKDKTHKVHGWRLMRSQPDIDNLHKPLVDAMQGICLKNDGSVVEVRSRKIRSDFIGIMVKMEIIKCDRSFQFFCSKNLTD